MYKRVHNYITPSYLSSLLVRNSEIYNRATRHSNIYLMRPKYKRKTEGGRTFTIRTIRDWNCMNAHIIFIIFSLKFSSEMIYFIVISCILIYICT